MWVNKSGSFQGVFQNGSSSPFRKIWQYKAFINKKFIFSLSKKLIKNKVGNQKNYLLRLQRNSPFNFDFRLEAKKNISQISRHLKLIDSSKSANELRGHEGNAAKLYFDCLSLFIKEKDFQFKGRSKRPPKSHFNCLISFTI